MLSSLLKKYAGRKAGATRGGKGGSHVHTSRNKRTASKATRQLTKEEIQEMDEIFDRMDKLFDKF